MMTAMSEVATTYSRRAFEQIRGMILNGEIAPGAKMVVRPLAEQLELSPTPIKAALAALERDGFLLAVPNRGYFVPTIDADDMREIFELRESFDGIAARKLARREDRAPICAELWRLHEQQVDAARRSELETYSVVNLAFHQLLWSASGNRRLGHLAETLVGQTRLATGTSARSPGRMDGAMREHHDIVRAIEDGDAAAAERLAKRHVLRSGRAFTEQAGADAPSA